MKLTLTNGIWEYWLRDKKTKEPLTAPSQVELFYKTSIDVELPEHLTQNKNVEVYVWRIR